MVPEQSLEAQSANYLFLAEKAFSIPSPLTSIVVLKLLGSSIDTPPLIAHSLKELPSDVSPLTSWEERRWKVLVLPVRFLPSTIIFREFSSGLTNSTERVYRL